MGDKASASYPPIDDVRIEYERQGVPSNIMFGHGMTEAHDPDAGKESRFGTINDLMFSGNVNCARSDKILQVKKRTGGDKSDPSVIPAARNNAAREKIKKEAREVRMDRSFSTTQTLQARKITGTGVPKSTVLANAATTSLNYSSGFTRSFTGGTHVVRE
jgi:hypothetical protein